MAKIKVNTTGISSLKSRATAVKKQADGCVSTISHVRTNIDMETASAGDIASRLQSLQKRMQAQEDKLEKYAAFLDRVNNDFAASDKKISRQAKNVQYLMDKFIVTSLVAKKTKYSASTMQDLQKIIGLAAIFWPVIDFKPGSAAWVQLHNLLSDGNGATTSGTTTSGAASSANPYTKKDSGTKVANFDKGYDSYMNKNQGGYKYQCVSYVRNRMVEKLKIDTHDTYAYGDAKDVAKKWTKEINKTKYVDENGQHYQVAKTTDGKKYKVQAYTSDKGSHIQTNSFVCFGATKNNSDGHIVFVESVQEENGVKYVYYSEGGSNIHKRGKDGILIRKSYEEFMNMSGGYTGCVTFTQM